MKANELEPTTHAFLRGYWYAISDYGIWKNGTQKIGCFEVDIKEAMQKKLDEFGIELSDFLKSDAKLV